MKDIQHLLGMGRKESEETYSYRFLETRGAEAVSKGEPGKVSSEEEIIGGFLMCSGICRQSWRAVLETTENGRLEKVG